MRLLALSLLSASLFAGVTCSPGSWSGTTKTCSQHPTTYTITPASFVEADVQAAFNDAWLGDTINFESYRTNSAAFTFTTGMRLTRRLHGSGVVKVTTTDSALLPNAGTRVTPSYAPVMARIIGTGDSRFHLAGGPGSADHFHFEGLDFRYYSADPFAWPSIERAFEIGSSSANNNNSSWSTTVVGNPTVGSNEVPVLSADAFAVSTPRQQVVMHSASAATPPIYKVVAVDHDANTITVCSDGSDTLALSGGGTCAGVTATGSSYKVWVILNREGESNLQPDDVEIRHCMFTTPPLFDGSGYPLGRQNIGYTVGKMDARKLIVADNYAMVYDASGSTNSESKMFVEGSAHGPLLFSNNYLFNGMAWMSGGGFSSTHANMAEGNTWEYNTFFNPDEILANGYTDATHWGWDFAFGPNSYYKSQMSVPGLPPHSSRFVIAGRSVWLDSYENAAHGYLGNPANVPGSLGLAKNFWTALNTGVVGTSKPACLETGGFDNGRNQYCYDGDTINRAAYGTTYCKDAAGAWVQYAGDGVCWRLGLPGAYSTIKNAYENKNGDNHTIRYNVFYGFPLDVATNTSQPYIMNFKISSAYYGDAINYPTVTPYGSETSYPIVRGCLFYTADAGLGGSSSCGSGRTCTLNSTGAATGWMYSPEKAAQWANSRVGAGYNEWPECNRSFGRHINIRNNWYKDAWSGIYLSGFYNVLGRGSSSGDYNVVGNLFTPPGPFDSQTTYAYITLNQNSDERNMQFALPISDINISNNTIYTPWNMSNSGVWQSMRGADKPVSPRTDADIYSGTLLFSGNVLASLGMTTFYRGSWGNGEARWFSTNFPKGPIGKQIFLGAMGHSATYGSYHTYQPSTIWTGCGHVSSDFTNTAKCYGSTGMNIPDYSKVFVNAAKNDFRVKNDHTFAKRAIAGADLGADPNQIPMIRGLTVTPTDRSVLFQYRLTPVIEHIPCAIELHTSPDLESTSYAGNSTGYAAELSNIATYYRQDADDADRNYRDGNRRMIVLGHTVNLTAGTPYYYRLHCGGDMATGMFTTLDTLTSTATQTIARTAKAATTANMLVTYGTAYSRATDTISGGGTASASCTAGNRCVVTFSATKGTVLYYRWAERNGSNTVLSTGKVEVMPAL